MKAGELETLRKEELHDHCVHTEKPSNICDLNVTSSHSQDRAFQKEQKPEQDDTNFEFLKKEAFCGSAKCREASASGITESPLVSPEWLKKRKKVPSVKKQMTNRRVICSFGRRNKKNGK